MSGRPLLHAISRSISRKLMLAALATTFAALLVAALAMVVIDVRSYDASLRNDLTTQADILAKVSTPALEFNDPQVARENLEQLQARPHMLAAAIYNAGGDLFAYYQRPGHNGAIPRAPALDGFRIAGSEVRLHRRIVKDGEIIGTVYLEARYQLGERLRSYLAILAGVTIASLGVGALLSSWLQAAITRPILALTDAARRVVEQRDFAQRVPRQSEDEVGLLVDAFNGMLGEVGERARALEESNLSLRAEMKERHEAEQALRVLNETLETRVAERTAALEQAHEQLRQAQKMEAVGQLTGGIAHDFNNLLAGLMGNLEMMQVRLAQGRPQDIGRHVDTAKSIADRAATLTHRLLAFSRRQTLDPRPLDVNRLVQSMEDLIRRTAGPGVQVETRLADGLWVTRCDPNQLENALLNLAINARDAMPGGGRLTISTASTHVAPDAALPELPPGDYVTIEVADSGVGMSQEVLSRAFDPFFTTKPVGQGTGLGLSMIYGFVTQSGGQIRIASMVGAGTTVRLHLPRHDGPAANADNGPQTPTVAAAARRSTILLVDDEADLRAVAGEMLRLLGYDVEEAPDGPAALQALQGGLAADLLITDYGLPGGMNGMQLANAVRGFLPALPILCVTGYAQNASLEDVVAGPPVEVMLKPFKMDALAAKIKAMLAG